MNAELTATKEAEEMLLGSILIDATGGGSDEMTWLVNTLKPDHFSDGHLPRPGNVRSRIYSAMLECDRTPHQVNVARKMVNLETLDKMDIAYMSHCISITPTHLDLRHYAAAVKD